MIEYKYQDPAKKNDFEYQIVTQFRPGLLIKNSGEYVCLAKLLIVKLKIFLIYWFLIQDPNRYLLSR